MTIEIVFYVWKIAISMVNKHKKTWKMTMKHGKSLIKNYCSRPTILIGKAQELRLLTGPFPRVNCVITRGYLWDCRGRTVYSLERNTRLATNYVWSYWSSSHDLEMSWELPWHIHGNYGGGATTQLPGVDRRIDAPQECKRLHKVGAAVQHT